MFTSVKSSDATPATLAMLQSSSFIAYAEQPGSRPAVPVATTVIEASSPLCKQQPAPESAAGTSLVGGAQTEAAPGDEQDSASAPSSELEAAQHDHLSQPDTASGFADIAVVAHGTGLLGAVGLAMVTTAESSCSSISRSESP